MERINELTSENIVQQNIERLKEIFPTAFSEGKLVVEELQALVGEYIQKEKEFYQMTWAGKTQAQREANKVSTGTLRPNKADSKDWETTGNIFIEGDNFEVLKLLQKTYSNQIKMIYIDPPYNTGKDFVYKDNYKDNLSNYLELTGQTDEEGKKTSTNTDSDGRFHSNWLNMMYPRLKLARNLLADDGVIFISIDDNEQANLKKLCDEIFGEENFVACINWRKTFNQSNIGNIAKVKEYILLYTKNINLLKLGRIPLSNEALKEYRYSDEKGKFARTRLMHTTRGRHKYSILSPNNVLLEGTWMVKKEDLEEMIKNNEVYWAKDGDGYPNGKVYLDNEKGQISNDFLGKEFGSNQQASLDLDKLMEGRFFDFPKPISLITHFIRLANDKTLYVLDFFSGSGTTAHAVMSLNAEDGGNRKCISVQLPEPTDEKSEAYKAGYKTIAEITKERIRRAGELIKQENKDKENIDKLDVGFRAFKLDSSNIRAWDTSVDQFEDQLDLFLENNGDSIKNDRTEEDVLFEILLKYGLELTLPIQEKTIANCKVYNIGFGAMYICLADHITVEVANGIAEWHKESVDEKPAVIFKDAGFANDADKTNTVQTLRQAGIENVKSI
ncbi:MULTISPECIES: site-specific DNA-methyltransferase [unclassified Empedobacter]|uniref:site-specific DNA-methyltransferase n=1 Tax=unclassified Empedobacter TaxID=2643773 RepID=UPI0025BDD02E|nr:MULTISPECIES: site-specific DNA-methyltransferase [unclassified Empedobacter]